jgi:AraC-like DNA-binding protein
MNEPKQGESELCRPGPDGDDSRPRASSYMINMYDEIRASERFRRLEVGDSLFVEYDCPIEDDAAGIWIPVDSFVHVLSGRKTWRTTQGSWTAQPGQTLYIKKGASVIEQHMEDDFCVLILFVSEEFLRRVIREASPFLQHGPAAPASQQERALTLRRDAALDLYFQSMLAYLSAKERPSDPLLELKLKELILSVLLSDSNAELAAYFLSLQSSDSTSIAEVMEANFCFNLSLDDFARLCHRSLSSFKRDFKAAFGTTPGKWLLERRLRYAAAMLRDREQQVTQVALKCGFEDLSHFSRSFKQQFGLTPSDYRAGRGSAG